MVQNVELESRFVPRANERDMVPWTEMRTALMVGRLGTVSATASAMGVHRSTVSRHIDVLEEALGTRLFLRHKEGYTLTEDGRHMLDVANKADSLFTEFANQVVSRPGDLKGVLTISAMSGAAPILPPVMLTFHRKHPRVTFRFVTETRLAKLEKNEAHVAIRTSPKPKEPDYVVTPLRSFRVGLYAHRDYLKEVGYPRVPQDLAKHRFVGPPNIASTPSLEHTVGRHLPAESVVVETLDPLVVLHSVLSGLGLGYVAAADAEPYPQLVEVLPPPEPHMAHAWIVTHVDAHRTPLVREFVSVLRTAT